MGTQKLLLPVAGKALLARVVDTLMRCPVDQVVVVVRPDRAGIAAALAGRSVTWVVNPDPASDMLGSVRCGLRAVPESCEALLVALGDQPGIRADVIAEMVRLFRETQCPLVVPAFRGRRGHPVLIALRYRDEILTGHGAAGLRGLLQAHAAEISEVSVDSADVLEDMDTPEDYQRVKARFPGEAEG